MWGCLSVIGLHPTPSASLYGVVGCVVTVRTTLCLQTVCDVLCIAIEERRVLLDGCCGCKLHEGNNMSQRCRAESEKSSSSSDDWDGLPSPDVLRWYLEPKWYTEQGFQTESGGFSGPYRGLGIPHRNTAARGQAPMAVRGIGDCTRGGCIGRWAYRPRQCGLW